LLARGFTRKGVTLLIPPHYLY